METHYRRLIQFLDKRSTHLALLLVFWFALAYHAFFLHRYFPDESDFFEFVRSTHFRNPWEMIRTLFTQTGAYSYGSLYWVWFKCINTVFGNASLRAIRVLHCLAYGCALLMFSQRLSQNWQKAFYILFVLVCPLTYWFGKMAGPEPLQLLAATFFVQELFFNRRPIRATFFLGLAVGIKLNALPLIPVTLAWVTWNNRQRFSAGAKALSASVGTLILGFVAANPVILTKIISGHPGEIGSALAYQANLKPYTFSQIANDPALRQGIRDFLYDIFFRNNWNRDFIFHGGFFAWQLPLVVVLGGIGLLLTFERILWGEVLFFVASVAAVGAAIVLRPRTSISYFVWYWIPTVPLQLMLLAKGLRLARKQFSHLFIVSGIWIAALLINGWVLIFTQGAHWEFDHGMRDHLAMQNCLKDFQTRNAQEPKLLPPVLDYAHRFPVYGDFAGPNCWGFPYMHCMIPPGNPPRILALANGARKLFEHYDRAPDGFSSFKRTAACPYMTIYLQE